MNDGSVAGPPRIVSLVPSLTELVFDLGLGPYLVGRTGFCVHPAGPLRNIPKLGGTKQVNEQALLALRPTHLLVNKDENEAPAVERLAQHIPHVLVTHPISVADNVGLFDQFASAFGEIAGVRSAARALTQDLQKELEANATGSLQWPAEKLRYIIWKDPWMCVASNTYIAAMLASVGWQTISMTPGGAPAERLHEVGAQRYPVLDQETLLDGACSRILLSSEPYRFQPRHVRALQLLSDARATSGRHACTIHLVDGEMCSWYGSRAIPGLRYLRQLRQRLTTE